MVIILLNMELLSKPYIFSASPSSLFSLLLVYFNFNFNCSSGF